jgi:hypothetical protein
MSEADTVTAADISRLNQAGVTRAANLARLAGTGLLIVGGIGLLAWAWATLRGLGLLGDSYEDYSDDPGFGFDDRIDLLASYTIVLACASLAAGLGVALRLAANYTVARTGGSLTGPRAGDPLAPVRRRPPTTEHGDGESEA